MADLEKDKLIKREITKYRKLFKEVDPDKKTFAEKLYTQAAFMGVTLDSLKEKINKDGAIIEATNGNGFKTKTEHPAQKSYNTMIRNYNATIKNLVELLPENNKKDDELMEFVNRKKRE